MGWQATFIKSAADRKGWIDDDIPEVLFVGRSNVGKSSLINVLTNNKKLAKVASTPGKTRLLNFFDVNRGQFRLVDAPGYGFAKISFDQKYSFEKMMEEYLEDRRNLIFVVMLVDSRRIPNDDDKLIYQFLKKHKIPALIVGTKLDKLKRNDIKKKEKIILDSLAIEPSDKLILCSSLTKENLFLVENEFNAKLEKGN